MKTEKYLKKIVKFTADYMSDVNYEIIGFSEDFDRICCYVKFSLKNRNHKRVLVFKKPADKRRQVQFIKSHDDL